MGQSKVIDLASVACAGRPAGFSLQQLGQLEYRLRWYALNSPVEPGSPAEEMNPSASDPISAAS